MYVYERVRARVQVISCVALARERETKGEPDKLAHPSMLVTKRMWRGYLVVIVDSHFAHESMLIESQESRAIDPVSSAHTAR